MQGVQPNHITSVSTVLHRLWALAGFAFNAQKGVLMSFSEIEARTQLVDQQADRLRELTQSLQIQTQERQEQAEADLRGLTNQTQTQIGDLSARLDAKVERIGAVITMIDRTSQELELLALNAKIQASHAGENGRAFAVVADNMRKLAQSSMENLASVRALLDFSEFQGQFDNFQNELNTTLGTVTLQLRDTLQTLGKGQQTMVEVTQSIQETNQTIPDMVSNSLDALHRQSSSLEPLVHAASSLQGAAQQGPAAWLSRVQGLHWDGHDLLGQVQARGRLRVAIEPAFWGLSFRIHKADTSLQGLDVDYIHAFARYLGVGVEWVEHPWVQCPQLLHTGRSVHEEAVDVMWSALLPSSAYHGIAYSEPYMHVNFVLLRRCGERSIRGVGDLEQRILGCLNDPAVFDFLEQSGVRWSKHAKHERGVRLANLIPYASMTELVTALAQGRIDAAPIDGPLAGWTCMDLKSPWLGLLECAPGSLNATPWHYAVGVRDDMSSLAMLHAINGFIAHFNASEERRLLHQRWHCPMVQGSGTYRDEAGNLRGETELAASQSVDQTTMLLV